MDPLFCDFTPRQVVLWKALRLKYRQTHRYPYLTAKELQRLAFVRWRLPRDEPMVTYTTNDASDVDVQWALAWVIAELWPLFTRVAAPADATGVYGPIPWLRLLH